MMSIIGGHKLDPRTLEETMRRELPPGASKSNVIEFVRAMRPLRCDDHGRTLRARWLEETEDLVHSWDIVAVFDFDEEGRLGRYSQTETDFIDYDLRALMRRW
jgi:hypothetical protein